MFIDRALITIKAGDGGNGMTSFIHYKGKVSGGPDGGDGISLAELLRRPALDYDALAEIDPSRPSLPRGVRMTAEISIKYEGYIKRQIAEVNRKARLEEKKIPVDIDYASVKGLRIEAVQKLSKVRPLTIGQASRISGVSPADISVLMIYIGIV